MSSKRIFRQHSNFSSILLRELSRLQLAGLLTDVVLKSGSVEVKAHRCILAACSEYFRATFTGLMRESEKGTTVELKHIDENSLIPIIRYIYDGNIEINGENATAILDAASHLRLNNLIDQCCAFLHQNIDIENCLQLHNLADAYNCSSLSNRAQAFIFRNFDDIMLTNEFLELSSDKLLYYMISDQVSVSSEYNLFNGIIKWIAVDPDSRKQYADVLLKTIRLELISPQTIANEIQSHPYFSCNRVVDVLLLNAYKWHCSSYTLSVSSCPTSANPNPLSPSSSLENSSPNASRRKSFLRTLAIRSSLYVFGGDDGFDDRNPYPDAQYFNMDKYEWIAVAPMHWRRSVCGFIALDANRLLAVGGYDGEHAMNSVELFDARRNVWRDICPLEQRRCSCNCAVLHEEVYAVGGVCGPHALNSVERYSEADNQWKPSPSMLESRSACGVVSICHPRPLLFAVGGITNNGDTSASGEVFDPSTQTWKSIAPMLSPRRSFGLATLGGVLYAVGGNDGNTDLRSVEAYDISSRTWRAVASMSRARMYCTVTVFEGSLLAIGGMDGMLTLNSVERYCAATDRWIPFLNLPKTVCGCGAAVADSVSISNVRKTPNKRKVKALVEDNDNDVFEDGRIRRRDRGPGFVVGSAEDNFSGDTSPLPDAIAGDDEISSDIEDDEALSSEEDLES